MNRPECTLRSDSTQFRPNLIPALTALAINPNLTVSGEIEQTVDSKTRNLLGHYEDLDSL